MMADEVDITNERMEAEMQALLAARAAEEGESEEYCIDCGEEIPPQRRELIKGVKRCVVCQEAWERRR